MATKPSNQIELNLLKDYNVIAGVDEVGRGCIAGPVVATAVIYPHNGFDIEGLNDSKKLSASKREALFEYLTTNVSYSYGMVFPEEIDKINILQATFRAMHLAINGLRYKPEFLMIDGNRFNDDSIPYTTVVSGDSKSVTIAAASIIAKVIRDKWVIENMAAEYKEYGFEKHKGYGTKAHYDAIDSYGITPHHRKSFLKKYFSKQIELF